MVTYYNSKFSKTDPYVTTFHFDIIGPSLCLSKLLGSPIFTSYGPIESQSIIDNFLGTSSEFTKNQFSSTSIGSKYFCGLINMNGQAIQSIAIESSYYTNDDDKNGSKFGSSTYGTGVIEINDSSHKTSIQVGSKGNMSFILNFGKHFESVKSGSFFIKVYWISK